MPNPPDDDVLCKAPCAEVRAHGRVMPYRCLGTGRPVLLLADVDRSAGPWPELVEALETCFRLIAPEPPSPPADLLCWLSDFLEGLGIEGVGLIAAGRFRLPALGLAQLDPDQVERLVLIDDGPLNGGPGASLDPSGLRSAVPLLLLGPERLSGEVVWAVTGFLAGGRKAAPA